MVKRILKYLFYGISWGWSFFVIINIIGVITVGDAYLKPIMDNFIQQALGSALVGICCGSSSIVYTFDKLPRWMQAGLHFAIGLSGYFAVAYKLDWIPVASTLQIVSYVALGILIFAAIWSCFYFYSKHEVKKVNRRIKELESKNSNFVK